MFEQEVPAEGKLELNVFACRGDVEVLGHDAATLRVAAQDPQIEYHVREEGHRFIVEASGAVRIDVPRATQLSIVAGPRQVSVHNVEGEFTVRSASDDQVLETATVFAREFSDVGRRLGADFGRLGRDLGEQFGRTFGAWGRGDFDDQSAGRPRRRGRRRGAGIDVDAFIRRAEEGAERFARAAEERAERFAQRTEERMQQAKQRAGERRPRAAGEASADSGPADAVEGAAETAATVAEERRAVLTMLQEGKISAEQAEELLQALRQ